jgi:site-specific DNA-adenine methylase
LFGTRRERQRAMRPSLTPPRTRPPTSSATRPLHVVEREPESFPCGTLRPFFGYYGGKWRDAIKHYPPPQHEVIVEPFAGSAGYSLRYAQRKVVLCELDPILAGVWKYLIEVSPAEIRRIRDLGPDECVDDLKVSQEARWLVGFWLNRATTSPRKRPSRWMRDEIRPGSFWGQRVRDTIASQVELIRHWKIYNCSYVDCPVTGAATWFVDPPYQGAGRHYRFGSSEIDFDELTDWCTSRPGLVIVCENDGAAWLPFHRLAHVKTTRANRRSKEVVWVNTFDSRSGASGALCRRGRK